MSRRGTKPPPCRPTRCTPQAANQAWDHGHCHGAAGDTRGDGRWLFKSRIVAAPQLVAIYGTPELTLRAAQRTQTPREREVIRLLATQSTPELTTAADSLALLDRFRIETLDVRR